MFSTRLQTTNVVSSRPSGLGVRHLPPGRSLTCSDGSRGRLISVSPTERLRVPTAPYRSHLSLRTERAIDVHPLPLPGRDRTDLLCHYVHGPHPSPFPKTVLRPTKVCSRTRGLGRVGALYVQLLCAPTESFASVTTLGTSGPTHGGDRPRLLY